MSMRSSTLESGVKILIAEDSPTQALQLQFLLEEHGYVVMAAANGAEALAAIRTHKPVLLISDVMMPEMNGYQLCKAIKSDEGLKDILVVLVTSLSSPHDVIAGLECGADSFIRKPYDEKYLLSRIDYLRANLALREKEWARTGLQIYLDGRLHFITSKRQQILDLLISTYDEAIGLQEGLQRSNQVLAGLYRMAEALNRANSTVEVCEAALAHALELPNIQKGWLFLKEGDSGTRLVAAQGFGSEAQILNALDIDCLCRHKLITNTLRPGEAVTKCIPLKVTLEGEVLALPHISIALWSSNQPIGVMNLSGADDWELKPDDRHAYESVGNQIGIALERVQLREHLESMVEARTKALTAEIGERQRVEDQLRQTLTKLEANNRELQEFAYVASHDLQEPLRKIQAFGDRLVAQLGKDLDEKSRDYLTRMQSAAERMQRLITDLLSFSRVTTRAGPFHLTDLNLAAQDALADLQIRIEESGGRVVVGPLPTVDADSVQIRQLFQNLIGNALKFHKPDVSPLVQVSAELKGAVCEITVADNGIGFDEKYLDRIFTIFQRLHGRGEYEGTGIGLSVVRKIAERHGGTVTARSTPGAGAAFVVTLPIRHPSSVSESEGG